MAFTRHPLSAIWPSLTGNEMQALRESMERDGYHHQQPIVLHEGMVLDGWHRYETALALGIECPTVEYDGDDAAGFVIGAHVGRRHLTPGQRAEAVVRCREWRTSPGRPAAESGNGSCEPISGKPATAAEMAEEADVSVSTIKRAKAATREPEAEDRGDGTDLDDLPTERPTATLGARHWKCRECGSAGNAMSSDTCWKCGAPRGGDPDTTGSPWLKRSKPDIVAELERVTGDLNQLRTEVETLRASVGDPVDAINKIQARRSAEIAERDQTIQRQRQTIGELRAEIKRLKADAS